MKAMLMHKPGDVELTELPTPEPGPDEVLIRIMTSGICTNDVRDYLGDCNYSYPRIGGHEYCGVIEKLGSAADTRHLRVGQRVVNYIIDDCHLCHLCHTGHENICEGLPQTKTFQNPDGISGYCGFAEYVCAKAEDIMVYSDTTPFEKMAFTEPLACVVNSVNWADIELAQDVVVIGGGTMGLLHVMLAQKRGGRVILSEPLAERRERALALGAAEVIDPTSCDAVARVRELTGGRGGDVVYNTCAHPKVAAQAIEMTAAAGTCVMFSSIHPNEPVPVDCGQLHSFQKKITGAVSPQKKAYYQAVQLIDKGIIDPTPLCEGIFDYTEFQKAMDTAIRPDTYKVIVRFGKE